MQVCFTSTLAMESTRTCATRKPTNSTPQTHRRCLSPQEGGQGRHPWWQEGQGRRQHAPSPKPPSPPNKQVCNGQASRLTSESLLHISQAFCSFLLFAVLVYKWWVVGRSSYLVPRQRTRQTVRHSSASCTSSSLTRCTPA